LEGEITANWLQDALKGTEAIPAGAPGQVRLTLSKNGAEVLVRGRVEAPVVVPCARTLAPIQLELETDLLLLLRRAEPIATSRPRNARGSKEGPGGSSKAKRHQQSEADAGHRPADRISKIRHKKPEGRRTRGGLAEDPELSLHDAAQDTFEGERIVLDPFVREFLLLELPMFPVRQDLPSLPVEARPSRPGSHEPTPAGQGNAEHPPATAPPIDPRLAPLAELKDRLQKKKQQE
jgi:uncharacterized protein